MAIYRKTNLPSEYDRDKIEEELKKIEQALEGFDILQLVELHREPQRPRDGTTVLADGTDWNPGAGQGVYTFYANAWHKLG